MNDTLFVQFYSQWKIRSNKHIWGISNGFSDTYNLCKDKGDFYWVHHEYDRKQCSVEYVETTCEKEELPIKKGKVFISATTTTHAYQSYVWAKRYPNIDFVVGGPAILTGTFTYNNLPKNLIFIKKSVEQYFGVPDFSYDWKLKLPNQIQQDDLDTFFTYSINGKCYWQKCIFCKFNNTNRARKVFDFKFKDNVNTNKTKIVFLYSPSMRAELMSNIIPKLPRRDDLRYVLFIRSSKKENKALQKVLKKCKNGEGPDVNKILFQIGLEFPGNRMLKYMKKGTSIDDIFDTLKIIKTYNSRLYMSLILGWPNLIKEDIYDVEKFVNKMSEYKRSNNNIFINICRLFARTGTPLYDMVEKEYRVNIGPFYNGSSIKLSKEQLILNNKARNLLNTIDNIVADTYTSTIESII